MLPQRVVGILYGQRRPIGRHTAALRLIGARQIAPERGKRPSISGNVMQQQQQHMLALAQHKQMHPQRGLTRKIKAVARRLRHGHTHSRRAHPRNLKQRSRQSAFQDLLPRNPKRVRKDRAQALVPLCYVAQRPLQGANVKLPSQTYCHGDVVGRARPFQAMQEPQPPLRKRQRNLGRTRQRHKRRACRLTRMQPLDQFLNGRGFEHATDGDLDIERGADPADQPRRQQRVAAELEEVVVNADPLEPENLGKQRAENVFLWRARRTHAARRQVRRRKRPPVKLAVRRERQLIQNHKRRRHHVVGKACPQIPRAANQAAVAALVPTDC